MVRLKVSKALISLSLGDLMKFDVIKEGEKSARGTQTYLANPDVLDVILNVLRRRERKMIAKAETGHKMLSSLKPESLERANLNAERIAAMGVMIGQAQNALISLLELATLDLQSWQEINETKKSL
jgi:DNA-binding transcriptional regulator GbsR (MarR family)